MIYAPNVSSFFVIALGLTPSLALEPCSLHSVLTRLMLASIVYYIWRKRNARLHGDAPHTSSMIYREIISCIVSKVNLFRNMASLITNRRLHISWGFSDDIFNSI